MVQHKTVHDPPVYPCDVCDKLFSCMRRLRIHKKTHQIVICGLCDAKMTEASISKHKSTYHSLNPTTFQCFFCNAILPNRDFWATTHRCVAMTERTKNPAKFAGLMKLYNNKLSDWKSVPTSYKVPLLFLWQTAMEDWEFEGTYDQSLGLNELIAPGSEPIPAVIGEIAPANRLVQVSLNQINVVDERRDLTLYSFSDDLDEAKIKEIRKRNKFLGRNWVFFGKSAMGNLHAKMTKKMNEIYYGRYEEGHAVGYQFGGDRKRSNLQIEAYNVNQGLKYYLECFIRALIRLGYEVSFVDGIIPKDQLPHEWLKPGELGEIIIELDGKQKIVASGAFMIIMAKNKKTGKYFGFNFCWPCHDAPNLANICWTALTVEYWWALLSSFIIPPFMLVELLGFRYLNLKQKLKQ
jgi:hypothetical protein